MPQGIRKWSVPTWSSGRAIAIYSGGYGDHLLLAVRLVVWLGAALLFFVTQFTLFEWFLFVYRYALRALSAYGWPYVEKCAFEISG